MATILKAAKAPESLLWTRRGKLRLTAVLSVLLAAHMVATLLIIELPTHFDRLVTERPARENTSAGALLGAHTYEAGQ